METQNFVFCSIFHGFRRRSVKKLVDSRGIQGITVAMATSFRPVKVVFMNFSDKIDLI